MKKVLNGVLCLAVLLAGVVNGASATSSTATGDIQVTCPPRLRVYIDGIFVGVSTADEDGKYVTGVTPGNHTVKVEKRGFVPRTFSVVVTAGRPIEVKVGELAPALPVAGGRRAQEPVGGEAMAATPPAPAPTNASAATPAANDDSTPAPTPTPTPKTTTPAREASSDRSPAVRADTSPTEPKKGGHKRLWIGLGAAAIGGGAAAAVAIGTGKSGDSGAPSVAGAWTGTVSFASAGGNTFRLTLRLQQAHDSASFTGSAEYADWEDGHVSPGTISQGTVTGSAVSFVVTLVDAAVGCPVGSRMCAHSFIGALNGNSMAGQVTTPHPATGSWSATR